MTKRHHIQARIICTKIWFVTISVDMISVFITAKNTLTDQHQILVPLIERKNSVKTFNWNFPRQNWGQVTFFLPSSHSQCWCTSPPAPSVRWNFAPTNPEPRKLLKFTQGMDKTLGKCAISKTLFKVYASYGKWDPCEIDFIFKVSNFPVISGIPGRITESIGKWQTSQAPFLAPKI